MNRRFLAVLLAAVAGGGLAVGQGPTGGANGVSTPPPNGLQGTDEEELTPSQMREKGLKIAQSAKDAAMSLRRTATRARSAGNAMLAECVAPYLAAVETLAAAARDRNATMNASFDRGAPDAGAHNFRVLTVIDGKIAEASKEASECLGEDLYDTADATTQFSVDPGTPLDDGTTVDGAPDLQIPLPPPESDPAFML